MLTVLMPNLWEEVRRKLVAVGLGVVHLEFMGDDELFGEGVTE